MVSVTVIIPHYGNPEPTSALVDVLHRQSGADLSIQVIVSDDCSPQPFPATEGVAVVRRETNGGFASAVNTGAELAEHPLLLILNSDIVIADSFVHDLVAAARPWMPAVVSPWVTSGAGEPSWTGRHFPKVRHHVAEWLTPLARWRHLRQFHEAVGHDTRPRQGFATTVDWLVGAILLMPTADFRAVGGFDERFFMNSEEVDLQRRLRERGVPSVLLGSPVALHDGGGSSDASLRRTWLVESRLRYAEKWGHRRRLVMTLGAATLVNLTWNSGRRALGRDVYPLSTARAELALLGIGSKE